VAKMQKAVYEEDIINENETELKESLGMFDLLNFQTIDIKTHNKIIGLNYKDINTFTIELSSKLMEIFKIIGATEIYIISHLKLDFFGNRENRFKHLVKAYKKLERIVGKDTYSEAFKIDLTNLADFIEILFWTTRCDPSIAEYIFLFDSDEALQINICKYGNIHLKEIGKEHFTRKVLTSLGWTIIDGQEYDNFSTDGKIRGRRIKV
jgi:hypothetical protein